MSIQDHFFHISSFKEEQGESHVFNNQLTTEMANQSQQYSVKLDDKQDKYNMNTLKSQDKTLILSKEKTILSNSVSKLINRRGNTYMYWFNNEELPRICIGPQWYVPIGLITFTLLITYLVFASLWTILHPYVKYGGLAIALIQMTSYLLTYLIDPGLPSNSLWLENCIPENMDKKKYRLCDICQLYMNLDKNTEHCPDCNICIEGMDHHCPWTSKCIARGNVIWFYLFIIFTYIYIFYFMFAFISIIVLHSKNK